MKQASELYNMMYYHSYCSIGVFLVYLKENKNYEYFTVLPRRRQPRQPECGPRKLRIFYRIS